MVDNAEHLVLEQLRAIRGELGDVKRLVVDHAQQIIGLRKQIHAVEGGMIRIEEGLALLDTRVEKIEKRLGLVDA